MQPNGKDLFFYPVGKLYFFNESVFSIFQIQQDEVVVWLVVCPIFKCDSAGEAAKDPKQTNNLNPATRQLNPASLPYQFNFADMIESLITSKTRIKLLLKFFLNSQTKSYLRSLETEFGESSNSIRVELNRLESAGLLSVTSEGNKKMFNANVRHPLFNDINNILKKFIGIDQIIDQLTSRIGDLKAAFVTGDFAIGKDSKIIDLALVGYQLDRPFIDTLVEKTETLISRRIKYIIVTTEEMTQYYQDKPVLLIWKSEK